MGKKAIDLIEKKWRNNSYGNPQKAKIKNITSKMVRRINDMIGFFEAINVDEDEQIPFMREINEFSERYHQR